MKEKTISEPNEDFYPVYSNVTLSEEVRLEARTLHPHGIVKPSTEEEGCLPCILLHLHRCSQYFPCHPDVREDKESVYLARRGKPE